jgi:SagB-type dehydrogenase family enzyme
MSRPTQTLTWVPWIHGCEDVPLDDPAEVFHEASRLYPRVADPRAQVRLLEASAELRASSRRATQRRSHLPPVPLPPGSPLSCALGDALLRRRTRRDWGDGDLELPDLAALLRAGYGVTGSAADHELRSVPSGGALYPLDLYVVALRVVGIQPALYHFDPLRDVLTRLREVPSSVEIAALSPCPELLLPSAALLVVTASFYRSRFKYGQRGYRFALFEAGHVVQNIVLAAAALDLPALPFGGFYDRRVDALLDADGLEEASTYMLVLGAA